MRSDRRRAAAAAQGVEDAAERHPLAGTVHLPMRRQDSLGQRRAGARHADDEHRCRIGIAGDRAGGEARAVQQGDVGVDELAVLQARERLRLAQQVVPCPPMRERLRRVVMPRPEPRQIVVRHDAVLWHRVRPHRTKRDCHPFRLAAGAGGMAVGRRQQHVPPVPEGSNLRRDGPELGQGIERRARLRRSAKLQQRECPLKLPMT